MSHAQGKIYNKNKELLGYFEYNGTCDVVCTRIYNTEKEMMDNWRGDNIRYCQCSDIPVDAILYSSYGNGFHWNAKICLNCRAIVDGLEPENDIKGEPK